MNLSSQDALLFCGGGAAISATLQTIEYLQIRRFTSAGGVWSWAILREDYLGSPPFVRSFLNVLLGDRGYFILLLVRLLAGAGFFLFPEAWVMGLLFASTALIAMRWRGTFNGGSDYMTLLVSGSVTLGLAFPGSETVSRAALGYIAIQLCLSYLIAGLAKLGRARWRDGRAFASLLASSAYPVPARVKGLASHPLFCVAGAWVVMLFECAFPLALWRMEACAPLLVAGALFHLANAYVLGLNRFWWAWISAYPAVLYWAGA